jgi:hypothetical protein
VYLKQSVHFTALVQFGPITSLLWGFGILVFNTVIEVFDESANVCQL